MFGDFATGTITVVGIAWHLNGNGMLLYSTIQIQTSIEF